MTIVLVSWPIYTYLDLFTGVEPGPVIDGEECQSGGGQTKLGGRTGKGAMIFEKRMIEYCYPIGGCSTAALWYM